MIAGRKWLKAIALGMVGAVMVTTSVEAQETAEIRTKREEAVAIARKGDLQLAAQSLADLFAETHEEMVEGVGEDVASRLEMFNSDCNEPSDFNYFGATGRGTPVLINKLE